MQTCAQRNTRRHSHGRWRFPIEEMSAFNARPSILAACGSNTSPTLSVHSSCISASTIAPIGSPPCQLPPAFTDARLP
eukprot:9214303-Pyramimonas_sp.AAC.3